MVKLLCSLQKDLGPIPDRQCLGHAFAPARWGGASDILKSDLFVGNVEKFSRIMRFVANHGDETTKDVMK